jgi:uncharacterized protein (UPF0261 family)
MRTTPAECAEIARITARKLNQASGPVIVLIPLQGVSGIDQRGGPFYSQSALHAYPSALKEALSPSVWLVEFDSTSTTLLLHIRCGIIGNYSRLNRSQN